MQSSTLISPIILTEYNTPWEKVLSLGTIVHFPAKRVISGKDWKSDAGMYYIKYGCIRLSYIALSGQERILLYMGKGTLFCEIPMLLSLDEYLFTCVEKTEAVFLPKKKISKEFIANHPELVLNLLQSLSKKTQHLYRQLCSLQSFDSFGNLCRSLYSMHMFQKINGKIVPHLSLQELAAFLGIHRSSLHKALARLREESIIGDYSKNRLEIYDLEKLSLYCKEPSE